MNRDHTSSQWKKRKERKNKLSPWSQVDTFDGWDVDPRSAWVVSPAEWHREGMSYTAS